jgi:hypothetical protein
MKRAAKSQTRSKRIDPMASRLNGIHSLREKELRNELRRIELAKRCCELKHKHEEQKLISRFKSQLERSNSNLEAIYYSTYHRRVSCEPLGKNTRALFALYELSLGKLDEERQQKQNTPHNQQEQIEQGTSPSEKASTSDQRQTAKKIKFNLVDKTTQTKKADISDSKSSEPLRLRSEYLNIKKRGYTQKKLITKLFEIQTQINQENTRNFVDSIHKKDSGFVLHENSKAYDYYSGLYGNLPKSSLFVEEEQSLADSFNSSLMLIEKRIRFKKKAANDPNPNTSNTNRNDMSLRQHSNSDDNHFMEPLKKQYVRSLTFIPPL